MTVSKIPPLKMFYHIMDVIDPLNEIPISTAYTIGIVSDTGEVFHGRYSISDGKLSEGRLQRGHSLWVDGDMATIGHELLIWLSNEHRRSGRPIQFLSWDITTSWKAIQDITKFGRDAMTGYCGFPKFIQPMPISISTLFLMADMDMLVPRAEHCGGLTDEQSKQNLALVEAYIDKGCFIQVSARLTPTNIELTGKLIDELFRSDSHPLVDLIEKWDLGYCLGQAMNNIYNISKSKGELREAYINNALWYLAHARSNEYTRKSFERDTTFHKHLSPSDFFAHYGTGNANIDNAMLDIEVARQYPAVFNELIDGAINYMKNELNETTEEL